MKSTFCVYILKCADDTLYVGSTNDLVRRLHQHNNAKAGAHYTKIRRPVAIVYSEKCKTFGESRSREAAIKRLTRAKKMELVISAQHRYA
ncbi:MAG TPA: GIY-YIG nuclease family protein [Candidatus Paceibacterota bacterium]|nr:GIY-YIG nuclease family protein [Candidatus Paceibacterota bacterium]